MRAVPIRTMEPDAVQRKEPLRFTQTPLSAC